MTKSGGRAAGSRAEDVEIHPGHEDIRGVSRFSSLKTKLRARLRWCLHVQRRNGGQTEVEYQASRQEENRRFMDGVKEDIQRDHLTEEDVRDKGRWRQVSCCGAP